MSAIFLAIAQNVILGWLWRRLQELVAWGAGLAPLFMALPPEYQHLIGEVLQGRGGGLSISVYIGFALYLWSQFQSFRATTKPQVVTTSGKKVVLPKGTGTTSSVEALAEAVPRARTLWDRLTNR